MLTLWIVWIGRVLQFAVEEDTDESIIQNGRFRLERCGGLQFFGISDHGRLLVILYAYLKRAQNLDFFRFLHSLVS